MAYMSRKNRKAPEGPFRLPEGEVKSPIGYQLSFLFILSVSMLGLGFFNLYSASSGENFFWNQIRNTLPAIFCFLVLGWVIPIRHFKSHGYFYFFAVLLALLAVLLTGHVAGGSQRWIGFFGIKIQPSEFAKITCAIAVAQYFYSNKLVQDYRLRDLWFVFSMIGAVFLLVFLQPDLGTAGICLMIAASQLAFVRVNPRSLGVLLGTGLVVVLTGWFSLREYQKLRIINLFNPEYDPQGSGYHSLQSLVAIGSGGFWGKGYLEGTQTQLQFLPARHTDFVFSVFAEEHGFIGGIILFAMFGGLSYLALDIARQSKDTFSSLFAIGISALLFIEFVINVAMVLGIFPVVGVPLPFFSYGGSAMLTIGASLGFLVAIQRDNQLRDADYDTTLRALRTISKVESNHASAQSAS